MNDTGAGYLETQLRATHSARGKNFQSGVECLGRLLNVVELTVLDHLDRAF